MALCPLLLVGCGSARSSSSPSPSFRTDTFGIAEMYGLQLQGTRLSKEVVLPRRFRELGWSLLQQACLNAGFDLRQHAGQRVLMQWQPIKQTIHGASLNLYTLEKEGVVVGAWLAVAGADPNVIGLRAGVNQF
jgi:hypothetical protein